jgi:hypothetical protein
MTTSNMPRNSRGALWSAVLAAAALTVAGCGGGGVTPLPAGAGGGGGGGGGATVTPTAYTLFASNYIAYQSQTNGAFLHSVQGGDVFTSFTGTIGYGCFSFNQAQMDSTQFYAIQAQADSNGGPPNGSNCTLNSNVAPATAADHAGITIKAPGTNSPTATTVAPLDISQSSTLLIQMGNIFTAGDVPGAKGGNAKVFTVVLSNDASLKGDGSGTTAECRFDQTLATVGRSAAAPLGVLNYAIPFSAFSCNKGSMTIMKSTGVTNITVGYSGDKNQIGVGDLDVIAVGYVGFTA